MSDHMFGRKVSIRGSVSTIDSFKVWLCNHGLYPSYKHVNSRNEVYFLNYKNVSLRGGEIISIFFFSKDKRNDTKTVLLRNFSVRENSRNGFLTIANIKNESDQTND